MNKIKGQGKITKFITSKIAARQKSEFLSYIQASENLRGLANSLSNDIAVNMRVVSFSSSHDFGEQVISLLSFIKYVGKPISWHLYSDGTHTVEQVSLIESAFPFLEVHSAQVDEQYINNNIKLSLLSYKNELISYASKFPLGKRLFLYLNFPIQGPTLFTDSDIIFYQKASDLVSLATEDQKGWYLPDAEWGNLDSRYMRQTAPQHYQVNGGLLLFNEELSNLDNAFNFFKSLHSSYEYFSEQTIMHILLKDNGFMPLDPRTFVLNSADQFDFFYLYAREGMAIRHYTGPVRHKMWQRGWKWHLAIQ